MKTNMKELNMNEMELVNGGIGINETPAGWYDEPVPTGAAPVSSTLNDILNSNTVFGGLFGTAHLCA